MKISTPILAALAVTFSVSAFAQAPKIAVIDMQGALLTTKDGQTAADELKAKFGPREEEFKKRGEALQAKQDAYRKLPATAGAAEKSSMERDIDSTQKALERDADDAKNDFQAEQNRLLGGIMQKMQSVMTKYAADHQISMIVDVSSQPNNLLYADKSANISEEIVKAFDSAAPAPAGTTAPVAPAPAAPKPPATAAPKAPAPKPSAPGVK